MLALLLAAYGFGATLGTSGTTDKILAGYAANLPATVSYAVWFNRHGAGGGSNGRIVEKGSTFEQLIQYRTTNGGEIVFGSNWSTTDGSWYTTDDPTVADTWQHLCLTYDRGATTNDPIIYVDGTLRSLTESANPDGTATLNTDGITMANRPANDRAWDGQFAEFAIYSRILTADECAWLAKGYAPSTLPVGLVFYAPLTRNAVDLSGAVSMTVTGALVQPHTRVILPVAPLVISP